MTGLSQTGEQTLDDIQSHEQTTANGTGDHELDAWVDMDDENTPMDDSITLSAKGGEITLLREHAGAYVLCFCPLSSLCSRNWGSHRYHWISRTWTHRIKAREAKWDLQLDALAEAYLAWKHDTSPVVTIDLEFTIQSVDICSKSYYLSPWPVCLYQLQITSTRGHSITSQPKAPNTGMLPFSVTAV